MSETPQDPWATVRTFTQTRTGLWPSDSGMWYCRTEVDAARAAEAAQHQQEMARLRALMLSDEDRIVELLAERDRLKAAFLELHATVKGECPSLLDPDRGGSDVLWALCAAALTPHQGQSTDGETR